MTIKAIQYRVTCDLCGTVHPFLFPFEPSEDDLNNVDEEFEFELDHCWEDHRVHKFSASCYCKSNQKGIWCGDCANKYWKAENNQIQAEYYKDAERLEVTK